VGAARPVGAVKVGDCRYYLPRDARELLGWDTRRIRRTFGDEVDEDVVAAVIDGAAPTSGRRPTWVADADAVDQVVLADRPGPPHQLAAERESSDYRSTAHGRDRTAHPMSLRRRLAELEGAYGSALEHREQLLEEIEALHRLGLSQVAAQRTLLEEMRSFSMPSFPPSS
jgi:hypothetical protein